MTTAPSIAPGIADALRPAYARTDVQTNGRTDERSDLSPVDISPVRYAHEQGKDSSTGGYRTPHGERRTYLAGCRCESCKVAHNRYGKQRRLRRLEGTSAHVPFDTFLRDLDGYTSLGFTDHALSRAAGLSDMTLGRARANGKPVLARTYRAMMSVDEPDEGMVPIALTRRRIRSLMRAGWPLATIEATSGQRCVTHGRWRYTTTVRVSFAHGIRDAYRQLSQLAGPSSQTAGRARVQGFPLPAAWDDPDTLAWPPAAPADDHGPVVDEVAIDRWFAGHDVALTPEERRQVILRAHDRGWSHNQVQARWRVSGATLARIRGGDFPGPRRGPQPKAPAA